MNASKGKPRRGSLTDHDQDRRGQTPTSTPSQLVSLVVDGLPITALQGQSLAAVLQTMGYLWWRRNPITQQPRGPFCGMGVCFECELLVNNQRRRACLTHVTDSMVVTTERERCMPGADL